MRRIAPLILLIALAACAKKPAPEDPAQTPAPEAAKSAAAGASPTALAPVTAARLAYDYRYDVALPNRKIEAMLDHDQQTCVSAGPLACQLIASNLSRQGHGFGGGELVIRATPAWISGFRAGIEGEIQAAGGKLRAADVQSEDLSRSIIDTQAAIRAKTTLRDRIQDLLANHPGKLSDVLDTERELARVQGELDAAQSEMAVMSTRVETFKLTIDYEALDGVSSDELWRPVQAAASSFTGNLIGAVAFLMTLVSYLLPVGLIAGAILWWGLRRRRPFRAQGGPTT